MTSFVFKCLFYILSNICMMTLTKWPNKHLPQVPLPWTTVWHPSTDKVPVWNFRILVGDCETMLQSKIEESHFEKADWHLGGWLANCSLGYRSGNSSVLLKNLVMVLSGTSTLGQETQQESHPSVCRVTYRPQTSFLAVYLETVCEPALAPLSCCGLWGPGGKLAKLGQNVDSEKAL